jgi:hypothetical protein
MFVLCLLYNKDKKDKKPGQPRQKKSSDKVHENKIKIPAGGGGEIFLTRPDRPWGPPSLIYKGYPVFFPG